MAEKLRKLNLDHLSKLKELGLNPEIEEVNGGLMMRLSDQEGRTTELPFIKEEHLYKKQKGYVPGSTFIPEDWRGKGVATEAYKAIESITGLPIFPDNEQTPAGYGLHNAKGYGKEFGLSEAQLESKLMPSEKMKRNARKKILTDILNNAANKADSGTSVENLQWDILPQLREALPEKEKTNMLTIARNAIREATDKKGTNSFSDYLKNNIPRYASKLKSMTPMALKGLGAAAGGVASLAAEASDAEEEGSSAEQAALLRDIDQRNREKAMLQAVPEQNRPTMQDELEAQRLGLRRSAIESLLKK